MIQDFQDNLVLANQAENLSAWITLKSKFYDQAVEILKILGK